MATDIQRTNQDNLDALAEPLAPEKREALKLVCCKLALTRQAFEAIEFEARLLRDFEAYGKAKLKTPRDRIKSLEKVAEIANALHAAMQEFDTADHIGLWHRMPSEDLPCSRIRTITRGPIVASARDVDSDSQVMYTITGGAGGRVGHIGREVEKLAQAAHDERADLGDSGIKGGRKITIRFYTWHVGQIWEAVKNSSMTLGRGGDFERLCDAVFNAADVHSKAAGAVRKFTTFAADDLNLIMYMSPYPPY